MSGVGLAVCYWVAFFLFVVAAITDYLDGAIARARNLITPFGQLFDPLADKLLTMSALVCFIEILTPVGRPYFPAWAVILVLSREFLVTGLRGLAASSGRVIQADNWGKHKTAWQLSGLTALLLVLALSITFFPPGQTEVSDIWVWIIEILRWVVLFSILFFTILSGAAFLQKNKDLLISKAADGQD
jgi:CDP-diacylglycerol--glycerol-3-phosphate 3-phosphatidyltransferase